MSDEILKLTRQLAAKLSGANQMICTAESCTGGLIAKTFTDLAGSSDWFERGFVTYSNQAKTDMLGVKAETLTQYGAVSEEVVGEMVTGALQHSDAEAAIAVTGIAGPGGGVIDKPVGTVWFGFAHEDRVVTEKQNFSGDREQVRHASLWYAVRRINELLC